jgi:transposase-like protein
MVGQDQAVKRRARRSVSSPLRSAFTGFRFPPEVTLVAIRWYLRYGLSYRDVEDCWPSGCRG